MPELEENLTTPEQTPEAPVEPQSEQPTEPAKPTEPPKEHKNILLPLLTTMLVIAGIGEIALCGYIALGAYGNVQVQRTYEAQVEAAQAQNNLNQDTAASSSPDPSRAEANGDATELPEEKRTAARRPSVTPGIASVDVYLSREATRSAIENPPIISAQYYLTGNPNDRVRSPRTLAED